MSWAPLLRLKEALGPEAELVVVGGAVRDELLGRPHSDWDLATQLLPEAVMAKAREIKKGEDADSQARAAWYLTELHDKFAVAALTGMANNASFDYDDAEGRAKACWALADACVRARKK